MPRSRRRRRASAAGTSTAVASSGRARTAQRSPAKARTCWFHPIGDSHDAHAGDPRSPMARSRYATPTTIRPAPVAARAPTASCAVTAPTPAKHRPVAAQPIPKAIDPAAGRPATTSATAVSTPIATQAMAAVSRAAASGAARPTIPAPSSSSRAGLLLGSRVPHDEDDHQHADHRGAERRRLEQRERAERGRVVDRPVERDDACGRVDRVGSLYPAGGGRIQARRRRRGQPRDAGEAKRVHGDQPPVPAQGVPEECTGPDEVLTHDGRS